MGIIGNGDIASVLPEVDRPDLLFFAAGVSNSGEVPESEYQREIDLLTAQPFEAHVVYFSSLGVLWGSSRYFEHKREMEQIAQNEFLDNTIVRIGNIDWGTNPHTLINYLRAHPDAELRDEWRYIVGKEEFVHWLGLIPVWSCEMNIPGERLTVKEVHERYIG